MKNHHSSMNTVRLYAAMDLWDLRKAYARRDFMRVKELNGCIVNYVSLGIISRYTSDRYYKMYRICDNERMKKWI